MTDSERLAAIKSNVWLGRYASSGDAEFLLRLLDTTRSERDATLARVGEYLEAHAALGRLYDTTEECKAAIEREERAFNALRAALTPPAYPPEQPL